MKLILYIGVLGDIYIPLTDGYEDMYNENCSSYELSYKILYRNEISQNYFE